MAIKETVRHILAELRGHGPFTLFGAVLGIGFMVLFQGLLHEETGRVLFKAFHPAHVVISAMVTASMFRLHSARRRVVLVLVVGYFGSIGVATLSDIVIPHLGRRVMGLDIPTHAAVHHGHEAEGEHDHAGHGHEAHEDCGRKIHFGFIEEWYLVNPAALLGIAIAFFLPRTKFPHAAHVLISTWASLSYLMMEMEASLSIGVVLGMLATLFLATWVPCCLSDIVFPLLFVKSDLEVAGTCKIHGRHSHAHQHKDEEVSD